MRLSAGDEHLSRIAFVAIPADMLPLRCPLETRLNCHGSVTFGGLFIDAKPALGLRFFAKRITCWRYSGDTMQASSERGSIADLASDAGREWLGSSVWQVPELGISKVKSWPSITVVNYHREAGEAIWRGDRHRVVLTLDQLPPLLVQIEQGTLGKCRSLRRELWRSVLPA